MQIRQGLDYGSAKIIKLAGAEYFVPVLAIKQNRICIPLIQALAPRIVEIATSNGMVRQSDIDDMLGLVHAAISRAYPDATFAELLEMEITMDELFAAYNVIVAQTRAFKTLEGGGTKGESEGETTASTAPPPPSTD
jgi:hypothetical protein